MTKKQTRGSSSGHVPVLPLTAEEARSVEQQQVAAQAQPVPSNNSLAPTVQYGNPIDTSSSTIPYDDNDMPAHEPPSDVEVIDDSDEEDDFYCQPLFPPPIAKAWTYYRDVETVLEGQAECFPSSHHEQSSQKLGIADRDLEIEIPYADRNWYYGLPKFKEDEVLIYKTKNFKKGAKSSPLIEKSLDALSSQEIKENWPAVQQAISNELQSFIDHSVFAKQPKSEAQNLCTSRWVLRWKMIEGKRAVKARLTIRGFQDQQEVNNYAGTATRWSQRLVVSIAVQEQWKLWIADVATAFLQSDTFEQLEHAGDATRDVSFSPPTGYEQEFLKLKGFETMNFQREVFKLLRPAYGLRDAPRAWKRKLDSILKKLGAIVMPTDASLYCFYQNKKLIGIVATHVDDLKGACTDACTKLILAGLTAEFGTLKTSIGEFEHCGLKHIQDSTGVRICQDHYAKQLRPIPLLGIDIKQIDTPLTAEQTTLFQSLLGGLSWLIQTRADICIYVVALQRVATRATVGHVLKLNQVVRWTIRQPCHIYYGRMSGKLKIACISDAAFRREFASGLSMRGAIVAIAEDSHGGRLHPVEYYSRKQRRVCRSTFAAELNGAVDAFETARLISITWSSIYMPGSTAEQIKTAEFAGKLPMPVDLYIDCYSILDSLKQEQVRTPAESTLILVLLSLKESLCSGMLRTLIWLDTRDQLADGLTKGAISRKALCEAFVTGKWKLAYKFEAFRELVRSQKDEA